MNQQAFEQACTGSEVDLISIDFSEKLPFRLKQHMVKAAIERGVFFEIAYSALLVDVQLRRQMITSAKLLVDWTRGKNLIISSAAPSVTEMRGPNDVANLSSLLGLSLEHAKAALSKNCRSLIAKALRKKHYYKEAVRVEIIPSGEEFDPNEHWPKDWMKWDPISSGEGDLFLDDMAKSFTAANKVAKTVKPIDFASIMDKLPSHGFQVQELIPVTEATTHSLKTDSIVDTEPKKLAKSFFDPSEGRNSLPVSSSQHQIDSCEDFVTLIPSTHTQGYLSNDKRTVTHFVDELEKHNSLDALNVHVSSLRTEAIYLQSENFIRRCDTQVDHIETIDSSPMDIDIIGAREAVSDTENSSLLINGIPLINMRTSSHSGVALGSQVNEIKLLSTERNLEVEHQLLPSSCELIYTDKENLKEITALPDATTDASRVGVSFDEEHETDHTAMKEVSMVMDAEMKGDLPRTFCETNGENREKKDGPVALPVLVPQHEINCSSQITLISEPSNEVAMEDHKEAEDHAQSSSPAIVLSVKKKTKLKIPSQACVFPFKRLLNRTPFKRKSNKSKSRNKLL